jgi:hypothetical protein
LRECLALSNRETRRISVCSPEIESGLMDNSSSADDDSQRENGNSDKNCKPEKLRVY